MQVSVLSTPAQTPDLAHVHLQSGGLLEALTAAALRSRLRQYNRVESEISCNFLGLLAGHVHSVHIYGTAWESRAGLTARVLEVTAQTDTTTM